MKPAQGVKLIKVEPTPEEVAKRTEMRFNKYNKTLTYTKNSGKSATKAVKTNGLNLPVVIWDVTPGKDKRPTTITMYIKPFGPQAVEKLDNRFFRFNTDNGHIMMAVQRWISQEEGLKGVTLEESYKEPYEWVSLEPGTFLRVTDFNGEYLEVPLFAPGHIFDLKPRYRKPGSKNIMGQPVNDAWSWKFDDLKGDIINKLEYRTLAYLSDVLPPEVFFFRDQRMENPNQDSLLIKITPTWDVESQRREIGKHVSVIGSWLPMDDAVSSWAISPKVPDDAGCVLPKPEGGRDKDKFTQKALHGFVSVVQSVNFLEQEVIVGVTAYQMALSQAFCVKDLSLWYYRMRYIIPHLPIMMFCSIRQKQTKSMITNVSNQGSAGKWRDPSVEEAKVVGVADLAKVPSAAAAHEEDDSNAHIEDDDAAKAAAFKKMMEKRAQAKRDQGPSVTQGVDVTADFGAEVVAERIVIDAHDLYGRYLIPVTHAWPMSYVKVGKEMHPHPYDRVHVSHSTGDFQLFPDKASLTMNRPATLPPVVCVSDYTPDPDLVEKFVSLAKRGDGSFHVAVNSRTFEKREDTANLFAAIAIMTPEEGNELLEKGTVVAGQKTDHPIKVSLEMEPIDKGRLYVLFYRNKHLGKDTLAKGIKATIDAHTKLPEGHTSLDQVVVKSQPPPTPVTESEPAYKTPQLTLERQPDVVMAPPKRPAAFVEEVSEEQSESQINATQDDPSGGGGKKKEKKEKKRKSSSKRHADEN